MYNGKKPTVGIIGCGSIARVKYMLSLRNLNVCNLFSILLATATLTELL